MPLKGKTSATTEAASTKAGEVFERINRFQRLPKTTETVSFRIPSNEKTRIRLVFERHGMTLGEGLKKAVYAYLEKLDGKRE